MLKFVSLHSSNDGPLTTIELCCHPNRSPLWLNPNCSQSSRPRRSVLQTSPDVRHRWKTRRWAKSLWRRRTADRRLDCTWFGWWHVRGRAMKLVSKKAIKSFHRSKTVVNIDSIRSFRIWLIKRWRHYSCVGGWVGHFLASHSDFDLPFCGWTAVSDTVWEKMRKDEKRLIKRRNSFFVFFASRVRCRPIRICCWWAVCCLHVVKHERRLVMNFSV